MAATASALKQRDHELIDPLPKVKRWEDLAYHFAVRASIERGLADADAGRLLDGDEVLTWIESWGTPHELPPPRARR